MRIKIEGANEVSHLNRFDELAVCVIDDDAIFLPVANPHVAVLGIHCRSVGLGEFSLSDIVAVPLIYEFAVLIEVYYARGAYIVGWREIDVIGALVRMTLEDIDIPIRSKVELHRLPEKPLSLGFIPTPSFSPHAEGHQE